MVLNVNQQYMMFQNQTSFAIPVPRELEDGQQLPLLYHRSNVAVRKVVAKFLTILCVCARACTCAQVLAF